MSADVFGALRTPPALGRVFRGDEDRPGGPPVVVISHALWQTRFGGQAGIVNKPIRLNGILHTLLGVMPAGFDFPNKVDVWLPLGPASAESNWQKRDNHPGLFGLARLKPGIALERARAELDLIAVRLEQQYPDSNKTRRVQIDRLLDHKVGNLRRALWILLGAVSFVLAIACANVANLLLARAAGREKEMVLRAALGAGRWRITRQLLTESALLAFLGAALGLLFAHGALWVVISLAGESMPRAGEIGLDLRVLLFSGLVALLTGLLFGLAPAWHASRPNLQSTLKEAGRSSTSSRAGLRQALVVAEVALTFVLLVGAGLPLLSFHRLSQVNPGFVSDRVLTFRLNLSEEKYPSDEQVGVVGRIKENRLTEQGGLVQAYFPVYQQPLRNLAVLVKTSAEPAAVLPTLRSQISQLDPALPIFELRTLHEIRNNNVASERLNLGLLGGFALLALILALIGLSGLVAFTVAQRQKEIGIRMALGAHRFEVLRLVIGQGMRLTLFGLVLGLLVAFALTRILAGVLFRVAPTDPLTFVTVTILLCIVALLACYFPARRATRVDPMGALRAE